MYYPNSAVATEPQSIGSTDQAGRLQWIPLHPGMASVGFLQTDDQGNSSISAAKTISVRFNGLPTLGLVVFLVAFVMLFGGIGLGVYHIFTNEQINEPPLDT